MRKTFTVSVNVPAEISDTEMQEYISDAICSHRGAMHPSDPLFKAGFDKLVVKRQQELVKLEEVDDGYVLQDNRSYVGNDILWWAKDGRGYTTDLSKAHVYSKEKAVAQNHCRETDIPWPLNYLRDKHRPAVDMQYVDIKIALQGTGVELYVPPKPVKGNEVLNCANCGKFIKEMEQYGPCPHCGSNDNYP